MRNIIIIAILVLGGALIGADATDAWWKSRSVVQHVKITCPYPEKGEAALQVPFVWCGGQIEALPEGSSITISNNVFITKPKK